MEIKWVHPSTLKPHPKNNNVHTPEQIERLARLLKYQGQRTPIVVSNLSGFIVKGHATLEAIKLNGVNTVAVMYQNFEDEAQEYAYLTSDNAIAAWASIDMASVYATVESLDIPDIDMLGFQEIGLDATEAQLPDLAEGDKTTLNTMTFTLTDEQKNSVERALDMAKKMGEFGETGNENANGNSIARIAELFLAKEYDA